MHEVLTTFDQISKLPTRDVINWVCERAWREIVWHERSGPRPILAFEPAELQQEGSFIFADPAGGVYRGGSIEAAIRTGILAEMNATGRPFLREREPRPTRNGNHGRR
jgi:hypothetical protein